MLHHFHKHIRCVTLGGLSHDINAGILQCLKPKFYLPNDTVQKAESHGTCTCFLSDGMAWHGVCVCTDNQWEVGDLYYDVQY